MNKMHFPDGFINTLLASVTTCLISDTPDVTALIFLNWYFVVSLMTFASDVFPHPGGPHRMILDSLSAFIVLYNSLSLPTMCSCPIISSVDLSFISIFPNTFVISVLL